MEQACQCPCGANQFSVSGEPIVRFFCHCTICQKKYNAPFADVVLFKLGAVTVPDQSVSFAKYKRVVSDRSWHLRSLPQTGDGENG